MASAPPSPDWAWPALIQSVQSEISHLREIVETMRRDAETAQRAHREELHRALTLHREELSTLIEQLRKVRDELDPILKEREDGERLARETRWSWIERAGWVVMGGIALAVYEFIKRHIVNE